MITVARFILLTGIVEKAMLHLKRRALCMFGLVSLAGVACLPGWASTCSDTVVRIRDAKVLPAGARCELVDLPDELIVITHIDGSFSGDALKALALKMAVAMAPATSSKRTVITFSEGSAGGRITAITVSAEQVKSLHEKANSVEAASLEAMQAEMAFVGGAGGQVAGSSSPNSAMSNLQMERNKLTTQIEQLRLKRVGVKPFVDEIARADEQLKEGNVTQAKATLDHLSGSIDEYEQQAKIAKMAGHATTTSQAPPMRQAPNMAAMMGASGGGALFGAAADRASASSLPTNSDAYYDEIASQILKRQVGDLAPVDGPMRLERFTIAKRITTLRQSGANVNNFITAFRKIEEIAGTKDPQKVLLLRDEIQYLNKQLGIQ
jgi:soluble cytochrome b562